MLCEGRRMGEGALNKWYMWSKAYHTSAGHEYPHSLLLIGQHAHTAYNSPKSNVVSKKVSHGIFGHIQFSNEKPQKLCSLSPRTPPKNGDTFLIKDTFSFLKHAV